VIKVGLVAAREVDQPMGRGAREPIGKALSPREKKKLVSGIQRRW